VRIEALAQSIGWATGANLSMHSYINTPSLSPALHLSRHRNPFCNLVKSSMKNAEQRCTACDIGLVQRLATTLQRPFLKRCHAGVCEAVQPFYHCDMLGGVIFVGPFREKNLKRPCELIQKKSLLPANAKTMRCKLPTLGDGNVVHVEHLATLFSEHIENAFRGHNEAGKICENPLKERIRNFIAENRQGNISLNLLSSFLNLSPSRVSQIVKEYFGMTLPQTVTRFRLEHARMLLTNTVLPIAEVSRQCGFNDPLYFSKVFHKEAHLTPREFHKRFYKLTMS